MDRGIFRRYRVERLQSQSPEIVRGHCQLVESDEQMPTTECYVMGLDSSSVVNSFRRYHEALSPVAAVKGVFSVWRVSSTKTEPRLASVSSSYCSCADSTQSPAPVAGFLVCADH